MDSTDPVRIEVETALSKGIPTIPILVGKTPMPKTEQLPESLRDFSFINAAPVDTGRDFHRDVDRVIATLDTILGRPLNVEGIGRLQASGAHAKARAGTDKTGGETRNSPKFLALVIGGLVFFGIFSGATWLLWVAKARNPAAVTSQLAGPANVGAEQGNSVATSTSSQGTSHNPADQLPVTAASPNVSGPQGNSPATSVGSHYHRQW